MLDPDLAAGCRGQSPEAAARRPDRARSRRHSSRGSSAPPRAPTPARATHRRREPSDYRPFLGSPIVMPCPEVRCFRCYLQRICSEHHLGFISINLNVGSIDFGAEHSLARRELDPKRKSLLLVELPCKIQCLRDGFKLALLLRGREPFHDGWPGTLTQGFDGVQHIDPPVVEQNIVATRWIARWLSSQSRQPSPTSPPTLKMAADQATEGQRGPLFLRGRRPRLRVVGFPCSLPKLSL